MRKEYLAGAIRLEKLINGCVKPVPRSNYGGFDGELLYGIYLASCCLPFSFDIDLLSYSFFSLLRKEIEYNFK